MSLATPESVQKLRVALRDKAKKSPNLRFYALYDKVYREDVLTFAYDCSKANGGAAGADERTQEERGPQRKGRRTRIGVIGLEARGGRSRAAGSTECAACSLRRLTEAGAAELGLGWKGSELKAPRHLTVLYDFPILSSRCGDLTANRRATNQAATASRAFEKAPLEKSRSEQIWMQYLGSARFIRPHGDPRRYSTSCIPLPSSQTLSSG
jgi:hypothetical protein